jgi:D-beta-D-heptose 7-phosphate kinase/D-beta-D-heptose 1-phosphate adenosyltransferase
MVKLTGTFSRLQKKNSLVIGDFMLDKYTYGNINRISPEAPVSILKVNNEKMQPGGAGNVVLNLLFLGSNVTAIGRIGDDLEGDILLNLLKQKNTNVDYLIVQKNYKTTVKNRFIAESQQVLRVDFEKIEPLDKEIEENIIEVLPQILGSIDVIAVSDYAKGFLSDKLIRYVIEIAREKKVPIVVDPKGSNFYKYKFANVLKPNLKEAYIAANLDKKEKLDKVAKILLKQTKVDHLLITRSQEGISLFSQNDIRKDFPVRSKEVKDVTGAGDTVLAIFCLSIANKLDLDHAAQLSNIGASIAIEYIGCAQITLSQFAKRLLEYDTENKIFDFSHLFALKKVLENNKFSLIGLNSNKGITTSIFRAIKKLASNKSQGIIVYILDPNPDDEFVDLLSSIHEVDFIILKDKNLKSLIEEIHPDNIYLMQEENLVKLESLEDLIKQFSYKYD